jgi:hypothetical protein
MMAVSCRGRRLGHTSQRGCELGATPASSEARQLHYGFRSLTCREAKQCNDPSHTHDDQKAQSFLPGSPRLHSLDVVASPTR